MPNVRKIRHFLYVYNIRMMYGGQENTSRFYRFALPTRSNHSLPRHTSNTDSPLMPTRNKTTLVLVNEVLPQLVTDLKSLFSSF